MMTGLLRSKGIRTSEKVVLHHLNSLDPAAAEHRRNGVRVRNPIPYFADHYGQKLHIDQNEKLFMYGVFQAACIDGYTGKIIRHIIIPQKNTMLLYEKLYVPILNEEGIWEMLRTDYGTEWSLILFVQNMLQQYRTDQSKPPYTQTYSKQNLRIERWWVEVNKRVNYPIKALLCQLTEGNELPSEDENQCFITGEFVRRVCEVGVKRLVNAWNHHRIDHRGTPVNGSTAVGTVPQQQILSTDDAARRYEETGGHITRPSRAFSICNELLSNLRDQQFFTTIGTIEQVYEKALAKDLGYFKNSLWQYVSITQNYQPI